MKIYIDMFIAIGKFHTQTRFIFLSMYTHLIIQKYVL